MTISANLPPSSKKPALRVQNLSYFIGRPILEHVSFTIAPGELVSFFGPNGGGKTTLLNLLMGFLTPTQGEIELFGLPPHKGRRKIGLLPQNFRPDPLFPITVIDVVSLGNPFGKEALQQVGMEKYADALFSSLSGGEAARVLLARALAGRPELLILDEPVANVDPAARKNIYALLQSLKGQMTILMVSHDLGGALQLSDRLFCVQQTVKEYRHEQLCHHFAQGLYHGDAP